MVIHDRSYSRWKGDRNRPVQATSVILRSGLRRSTGILFRRKLPAIGLLLFAFGPFVFAIGFLFVKHYVLLNAAKYPEVAEMLQNDDISEVISANPDTVFQYMLLTQSPFVVVACVMLGAGLLAEDRRSNALELYFARPVGIAQYLLAKLATIGTILAAITVIPTAIAIAVDTSMTYGDPGAMGRKAALLGRTLIAGSVWVLIPSLLIVTASSLTQRARNAAILFLGVVIMLEFVISNILIEVFNEPLWQLLQPSFNVRQFGAWVLEATRELDPAVPVWASGVVLAGWVAVCVPLLVRRVRPVEVVA